MGRVTFLFSLLNSTFLRFLGSSQVSLSAVTSTHSRDGPGFEQGSTSPVCPNAYPTYISATQADPSCAPYSQKLGDYAVPRRPGLQCPYNCSEFAQENALYNNTASSPPLRPISAHPMYLSIPECSQVSTYLSLSSREMMLSPNHPPAWASVPSRAGGGGVGGPGGQPNGC